MELQNAAAACVSSVCAKQSKTAYVAHPGEKHQMLCRQAASKNSLQHMQLLPGYMLYSLSLHLKIKT